jgi:N-terminal domain of toast_rack, DUF2154
MAETESPRRGSLVFPVLLIALGALFLYATWRPAFDPWPILTTYWPLILIFVGLGKMWDVTRQRQNPAAPRPGLSVGSTIGAVAFILVLVALFWHGRAFSHDRRSSSASSLQHQSSAVERQNAKSVHASLQAGAGEFTVSGGASHLLDADFTYSDSYEAPRVSYHVSNGVGQLDISQDDKSSHFGRSHNEWNLRFSNDVPLELKVEMGAGRGNLRLRDVQITRLDMSMGAGQADVDLTGDRKLSVEGDLEGGVGQATIRLPRSVGVAVHASGGIGVVDAHGFKYDGDQYSNEVYGKTPATIRLKVQGGVGQITLIEE